MGMADTLAQNIQGVGGYTDPLIFAIPIAIVVIVIVIVISASKIDSQQRRVRNEDRLLDTLERVRLENTAEDSEYSDIDLALKEAEEVDSLDDDLDSAGEGLGEEDLSRDADQDSDWEDEEFEEEDEPAVKPSNAVCDPDGLCFIPLPGQTVEEARHIARAKRDGSYEQGVTEQEAKEKFGAIPEEQSLEEALVSPSPEPQDSGQSQDEETEESLPAKTDADEETIDEGSKTDKAAEEDLETEEAEEESSAPEEETTTFEDTAAVEEETAAALDLEKPESKTSRLRRLKERLAGKGTVGRAILGMLSRADLEESDWESISDELLTADFGVESTAELIEKLKTKQKVAGTKDAKEVRRMAKRMIGDLLDRHADRLLHLNPPEDSEHSTVGVLVVGVNGGGKTTTVGKLARLLVAEKRSVVLGAADTFRAAAGEQLETWGSRVGVPVVRSQKDKADPASVAFDAAKKACEINADVVVIDTAGRLQNKSGLMDELKKIKRVAEKQVPITEVLLVIDATTGQNALSQAKIFTEAVGVTGIVLTKLDGSAKGGVVVVLQRELGIPVKLVGLGEGPDDLAPFVPGDFADALLDA